MVFGLRRIQRGIFVGRFIQIIGAAYSHRRNRQFRAQGLCVGSRVVEAGCKTVIGVRCKRAGMHWTVAGADAIIALRCCKLSGRFEDFWERRSAADCFSPRNETHVRSEESHLRRGKNVVAHANDCGGVLDNSIREGNNCEQREENCRGSLESLVGDGHNSRRLNQNHLRHHKDLLRYAKDLVRRLFF